MGLEKKHQGEVHTSLAQFGGFVFKMVQDSNTCPYCHKQIHPLHKGWPDYSAEIPTIHMRNDSIKVEMKAGTDRLNFNQISEDQYKFFNEYKGTLWLWLQLGDRQVNSTHYMARKVWMIYIHDFLNIKKTIETELKLKYIPMSPAVIISKNMRFNKPELSVENIFYNSRMEWMGKDIWRPNRNHFIWDLIKPEIDYERFGISN